MSSADWNSDAVEPVLRVLYQAGIGISPAAIAANLDEYLDAPPDSEEIRHALDELREAELVRTLDGGEYFLLTDGGRSYVGNEIEQEGYGFID
jgi:hypothetical protein